MITAGRSRLAKAATAAVIDTLEWKDVPTDESTVIRPMNPWMEHDGTECYRDLQSTDLVGVE